MVLPLILGIAAALGLAGLLWARSRAGVQEAVYSFRCPGCQQKLRYAAHKAGHRGICPRCKAPCAYPTEPGPLKPPPPSAAATKLVRHARRRV
jgi:hypothetical protein